jgi:hypothetical protein
MPTLEELRQRFALPADARDLEQFDQTVEVGPLRMRLAGVTARLGDVIYAGSAAHETEDPLPRAYFELLERLSIGQAILSSGEHTLHDATRTSAAQQGTRLPASLLFKPNPEPQRWRHALSNGVALGETWAHACSRALAEVVERDAVLRSWFGRLPLHPLPADAAVGWRILSELYELEVRCVQWLGHWVVVGVGFPREASTPLGLGFGARRELNEASQVALREFVQRLGFLWGESIPECEPEPAPSVDYHQEWGLWTGSHGALRQWLERAAGVASLEPEPDPPALGFADLTYREIQGQLHVARAHAPALCPLIFGTGYSLEGVGAVQGAHPIA